ncbi:hypothetical protein BZA70DRAFT_272151 [Myxozyma melibiosi]|uniref:t-SNARE coiled-coil homology domain-containing protein n=1 Tax=Myxozyma melibiosi TaxID=54550 RepID=A0ABR1FDE1_9ASCO
MTLQDLTTIVEKITETVEQLETSSSTASAEQVAIELEDGGLGDSEVEKQAFGLFRDTIRRNMLNTNLEYARKLLTQIDSGAMTSDTSDPYLKSKAIIFAERKRIRNVQDKLQTVDEDISHRAQKVTKNLEILKKTKIRAAKKQPSEEQSDPLDATPDPEQDSMLSAPTTDSEKWQQFSSLPSSKQTTLEDRLQYHREQQDALTESLIQQTSILKRNAMALGEKLEKDKDVVMNAMHALDRNVDNMRRTGGRLSQYRELSAIGWKFYIVSVGVMFFAVLIAMIVIKVLPKW